MFPGKNNLLSLMTDRHRRHCWNRFILDLSCCRSIPCRGSMTVMTSAPIARCIPTTVRWRIFAISFARRTRAISASLPALLRLLYVKRRKVPDFKIALQVLLCPVTDIAADKQVAPRVRGGVFPRRTLVGCHPSRLIARQKASSIAPAGRNSENSSTQLSGGSRSNSITDESLPKLPYGTCRPMRIGDDVVERSFDQMAVLIRDGQRGQQLNRMVAVARDLREQFVIIEQRDDDQLAEQSAARGFQQIPGCPEPGRARRSELDADHQPFAANRSDQFVAADISSKERNRRSPSCADLSISRSDSITCNVARPAAMARSFFENVDP